MSDFKERYDQLMSQLKYKDITLKTREISGMMQN